MYGALIVRPLSRSINGYVPQGRGAAIHYEDGPLRFWEKPGHHVPTCVDSKTNDVRERKRVGLWSKIRYAGWR